ncbi:sulfonate ABC transporter permease [Clostridia bacterium]|nr:sulfonate ABC transporter permease [Clostridia bacterium]
MKKRNRNQTTISVPHSLYLKREKRRKAAVRACQFGLLFLALGLWEAAAQLKIIDSFMFSSPSRIAAEIAGLAKRGTLFTHIFTTLYECAIGFAAATAAGVLIAVLLWWSENVRRVLDPYIVVLNSLPKIALGPMIIIWFGAGVKAIIFMAVLISVIVAVLSILNGFLSCDPDKILLLRSMGGNKFQILFKLVLPHSLPDIISALKINVGLAWVGTIMGEYLVSRSGLGYLIVYGGTVFKIDLVMAATVILCVLAGFMYFGVAAVERRVAKHRGGV